MTPDPPSTGSMPPNTPNASADLDQVWTYLRPGIDDVMAKPEAGLPFTQYTNFYTTVYNYCRSGAGRFPSHGRPPHKRTKNTLGLDLYRKLDDYFIQHLQPIMQKSESLQDVDLLRYYASEWDRYTTAAKYLNRLFDYLNRYWVTRERAEGRKSVYPIYTLALAKWKIHLLEPLQKDNPKLTHALLSQITRERDGEPIDQDIIKRVVDSFVSLDFDMSDLDKECLDIYQDQFERAFLQATEDYYEAESEAFLLENTVSDYLRKVEGRLREEEARAERYLHATTRGDLISKCERTLISTHSERIRESFQSLLDSGKDEDLRRMYTLLSRVPGGLGPLREGFEGYEVNGQDIATTLQDDIQVP